MEEKGWVTPYEIVNESPEDYSKLRRHKNAKYRFAPREAYEPLPL
jgi:hypothetical protein